MWMWRPTPKLITLLVPAAMGISCLQSEARPVEIALNEELCSQCRMAVSQRQFAAEVVTPAGSVDYFDDIGCLARWSRDRQFPEKAGVFVVDHETGEWLAAAEAFYVRSENLPTPMGYGLAAHGSRTRAQAFAEGLQGRLLTWQQLTTEDRP